MFENRGRLGGNMIQIFSILKYSNWQQIHIFCSVVSSYSQRCIKVSLFWSGSLSSGSSKILCSFKGHAAGSLQLKIFNRSLLKFHALLGRWIRDSLSELRCSQRVTSVEPELKLHQWSHGIRLGPMFKELPMLGFCVQFVDSEGHR